MLSTNNQIETTETTVVRELENKQTNTKILQYIDPGKYCNHCLKSVCQCEFFSMLHIASMHLHFVDILTCVLNSRNTIHRVFAENKTLIRNYRSHP